MTASEQTATPSSSVATTTTSSASPMAATSAGSSSSSSSSIGDLGKLSGAAIIFPNPSGWVLDTLTQKDVHDFMVRFQLANSSVSVQALTWSVDGSRLTELVRAEPADNNGTLFQNPQTGLDRTAILNVRDVVAKYQQELGKPMVVGVEWALDNGAGGPTGYTYSPAFSIVGDGSKSSSDAYTAISNSQYEKSVETVNDSSSTTTTTTGGRMAPAPTNSGSLSPPTIGGSSSSSNHGRSSGGGLSTGAIAGLAVGVGLAALLAAALAVFFCMRRRRRRDTAAAAAATASSATDDNATVLEQKRAEMENLRAYSQSGGAAAPYRDDNNNNNNTSSSSRRRSSTAQRGTPRSERSAQGVSQHLVEEGMTEEDIRRLEEEEAHLDNEILRANERR